MMQGAPGMEKVDVEWKRKARAYPMGFQQQSDSDERKEPNENSWSEEESSGSPSVANSERSLDYS